MPAGDRRHRAVSARARPAGGHLAGVRLDRGAPAQRGDLQVQPERRRHAGRGARLQRPGRTGRQPRRVPPRRSGALDGRGSEAGAARRHLHGDLPGDLGRYAHRLRRPRVQPRPCGRRAEVHGCGPDRKEQERQGDRGRLRRGARPGLHHDRAAARRPGVRAGGLAARLRRGRGLRAGMAAGGARLRGAHAPAAGRRRRARRDRERARDPAAGRFGGGRVAVVVAEKHDPAEHLGKPLWRGVGPARDRLAGAGVPARRGAQATHALAVRPDRAVRRLPGGHAGAQRPREHPEPHRRVLPLRRPARARRERMGGRHRLPAAGAAGGHTPADGSAAQPPAGWPRSRASPRWRSRR